MPEVRVTVDGEAFVLQVEEGDNLVQAAMEQEVPLAYDCLMGTCDVCRVRVVSGAENLSAPTDNEEAFLAGDLADGVRLACQCKIHGPVEVEQETY